MRLALVTPHYPPLRTSAAIQMRDLAQELLSQGHEPVIITPSSEINDLWSEEIVDGVMVLRLKGPDIMGASYLRRTISEAMLPFSMIRGLRKSPYIDTPWDIVAWYSPTIFFGPLINVMKKKSNAHAYLILRDIFPEWAHDLGLIRKGPAYAFFKAVAQYQYSVANTIGVQTPSNLPYLEEWSKRPGRHLEVLSNWQIPAPNIGTGIDLSDTVLKGRKIFVYIGNMGVAQGMDNLMGLAKRLKSHDDIGFLFVGRGSELSRLKSIVAEQSLTNTLFYDEVDPTEIPGLLAQCHIGLLALDPRHKSHNIPGKFLSYLLAGLPVLAKVNAGTDLVRLIEDEAVGAAYVGDSLDEFTDTALGLINNAGEHKEMADSGLALAGRMFSPATVVEQITAAASR